MLIPCAPRRHFSLLKNRIEEMGYAFGDFPVHNGASPCRALREQH